MTIITRTSELQELCSQINLAHRFALDLEFIPEHTYSPHLCLVQVATDVASFIIDPFVLSDLTPLWQCVADPDILVVLHSAEQDLDLVYTLSGLVPQNILDTQIAAGFLGLGYPIGYSKLLNQLLGISIAKTESFTNWGQRPLSHSQISYAHDDVKHLLPIYHCLAERLESLKRFAWVEEECKRYCNPQYYESDPAKDLFKIKGANSLNRRGLAILGELVAWRRAVAKSLNRPIRSILSDTVLLELARRPPKQVADIKHVRGVRPHQLKEWENNLLAAIDAGMQVKESNCPKWPVVRLSSKQEMLTADVLSTILRVLCYELDMAPELVSTRNSLETLVHLHSEHKTKESNLPLLKGWRYEIAGKWLLAFLNGSDLLLAYSANQQRLKMDLAARIGNQPANDLTIRPSH